MENKEVILAVIDTGIDFEHPDLKNRIFKNSGEMGIDNNGNNKSSNGIDDDNNGFIDDFQGWDFVNKIDIFPADVNDDFTDWDNIPMDENGHGTNISGIIGAEHNNIGIAGVDPNVKILNLRAFDKNGNGDEDDAAAAIIYAVKMGAKVINMSWGDTEFSNVLKDIIQYAYENNVILVASSGNASSDLPHYPSSFSQVISVGAIQENNALASFSNYGSTMDLVAPGSQIITTGLKNTYKKVSGTSAAAPFVSGAASIIASLKDYKNEEVKQLLKSTAKDLGDIGWDEKYGAGGLNILKAVSLLTPSEIKFNFPEQDFATSGDSLKIRITCVSPYFKNYSLFYGVGFNPTEWQEIEVKNNDYQIVNEVVNHLDLINFPDTSYTLRLIMNKIDNTNLEERINFSVDRSPPKIVSFNLFPAMLNDIETVQVSLVTDDFTTAKLFYRTINSGEAFKQISLDGFINEANFVSQKHFGFLPEEEVMTCIDHEFYFEVINSSGLTTILKDGESYFRMNNSIKREVIGSTQKEFSLPTGRIFPEAVKFGNLPSDYILLNETETSSDLSIFKFGNNEFIKEKTIKKRIPISVGDFNKDGKTDILNLFVKNGFIETQESINSLNLINVFSDTSGNFWPSMAADIDGDNNFEIIYFVDDTTFSVTEVQSNFSLNKETTLHNFVTPENGVASSIFRNNLTLISDFDNDTKNEIVTVDNFGRILFYQINGNGSYKNDFIVEPFYPIESNSTLAMGDYNGDGQIDLAILMEFEENVFTTPLIYSAVISFIDGRLVYLFQNMFISTESNFVSSFQKQYRALKFIDFNNDDKDELIIYTFPNYYMFEYVDQNNSKLIDFKTNVNSQSIFIGDLDNNALSEFSIPDNKTLNFYELTNNSLMQPPVITDFYSIDTNRNYLEWKGNNLPVYIYRGEEVNNLTLYDSSIANIFIDSNTIAYKNYFYTIANYDVLDGKLISLKSRIVNIFSHAPILLNNVIVNNNKNIELKFNGTVSTNKITAQNFIIDDKIIPNTFVLSSQNSFLLSFTDKLEVGNHTIKASNLRDFYNSPIKDTSLTFEIFENNDINELIISNFRIIDNHNLIIRFNMSLDSITALNTSNYTLVPNNNIKSIMFSNDNSEIHLSTENPFGSIGREYVLNVENVYSSVESGYLKISDNSGSQIILTGKAENLDGLYVYPQPVNINTSSVLTFANIPNNVEILIYDLNGRFINKILEEDGNGGVDWDLRDENSKLVSSGIYFYKAISKDNFGETIQEKLGKFAVIK